MPSYPPYALTAYVHLTSLYLRILWSYAHNLVYYDLFFAVKSKLASFQTFANPYNNQKPLLLHNEAGKQKAP